MAVLVATGAAGAGATGLFGALWCTGTVVARGATALGCTTGPMSFTTGFFGAAAATADGLANFVTIGLLTDGAACGFFTTDGALWAGAFTYRRLNVCERDALVV